MDDVQYQVLITGQLSGTLASPQAISAFAHLFCIPPAEAEARFAQAPFVVRGHLSRDQAEKYCRVMRRRGIQCEFRVEELTTALYPRLSFSDEN